MKKVKTFSLILCLAAVLCSLSFAGYAVSDDQDPGDNRIQNCMRCCAEKKAVCVNIKADLRLCEAVYQECIATCKSEGKSPSEWRDCWFQQDQ